MALNFAPLNQLAEGIEKLAKIMNRIAVPLVGILLTLEVVIGIKMGIVLRLTKFVGDIVAMLTNPNLLYLVGIVCLTVLLKQKGQ